MRASPTLHQQDPPDDGYTVITRKGQITLPAAVRRLLGWEQGVRLVVRVPVLNTQEVTLQPVQSVADSTFGMLPSPIKHPANLKALRRGFEAGAGREVAKEA